MLVQYCGAQREVTISTPREADLERYMPERVVADTSKASGCKSNKAGEAD
jgi:hypothetical protein